MTLILPGVWLLFNFVNSCLIIIINFYSVSKWSLWKKIWIVFLRICCLQSKNKNTFPILLFRGDLHFNSFSSALNILSLGDLFWWWERSSLLYDLWLKLFLLLCCLNSGLVLSRNDAFFLTPVTASAAGDDDAGGGEGGGGGGRGSRGGVLPVTELCSEVWFWNWVTGAGSFWVDTCFLLRSFRFTSLMMK